MPAVDPFVAVARGWHDFYLLSGGAAATLTGLMFVAVTFGSRLVTVESAISARAFIDPPLSHFINVLLVACLFVMPAMTGPILGALLLFAVTVRVVGLVWVYRQYRRAHLTKGDIEASDWLLAIVLPGAIFLVAIVAAIGFLQGRPEAFGLLAAANLATLVLGIRMAWELMLWMAAEMGARADATPGEVPGERRGQSKNRASS